MVLSAETTNRVFLVGALVCTLAAAGAAAAPKVPAILSTDIGNEIDDQWAVVYMLVNHDVFDVLGIISAHAPSLPAPAAHSTYKVLVDTVENHLNMIDHPPLFEGSSLPLNDTATPRANAGVSFLVTESRRFSSSDRLTVLTIGAATDVASAILLDPTITQRIRVVTMAFNNWPEGGNEYNVANDVKAWQVILNSDVPVVIGSGSVCRAHLALGLEQARNLVGSHGPVGAWLWSEFETWYYRFVKPLRKDDFSKPWIIWDTIVLAYVEGLTEQVTYARPSMSDEMKFGPGRKGETITWITSVDSARMWDDFLQKLDAYQRTHATRR